MFWSWGKKNKQKKSEEWIKSTLEEINQLYIPGAMFSMKDDESYLKDDDSELELYAQWAKKLQERREKTFQRELMKYIEAKGMTNREFYKAALIDRKLFSAIKNNPAYKPKKETAVACCLGLGLDWEEATELLDVAGYTLSLAIPWDRVIYYCLNELSLFALFQLKQCFFFDRIKILKNLKNSTHNLNRSYNRRFI